MPTPKSLHAQCLKGAEHLLAKNYQSAANAFDAVLKVDPDHMEANAGVAALLYDTGNARPAYKYVEKALKSGSGNVSLLYLTVEIALRLGKFDDAKHYATKAYKLAPKSADGIKAYLLYLQSIGDAQKVERLVPQLLALDKSATSRLTAGTALETTGRIIEAIRIYRNAIRDILAAKSPPPYQRAQTRTRARRTLCLT